MTGDPLKELLLCIVLSSVVIASSCVAPSRARSADAVRLESREDCIRYATVFCRRSVAPADACTSDLATRYCR